MREPDGARAQTGNDREPARGQTPRRGRSGPQALAELRRVINRRRETRWRRVVNAAGERQRAQIVLET